MSVFVETSIFSVKREKLFDGDEEFARFQQALLTNPEQGAVIPGTGGLRKIRWAEPSRGKGKRGGLRVIYLHLESVGKFYLITAYSKNDSDDLSADDKRLFKNMVERIQNEAQRNG